MDSLTTNRQLFWVDNGRCLNCRRCLAQKICPVKAIVRIDRDDPPFIDAHRCHGCRICLIECPSNAIAIR